MRRFLALLLSVCLVLGALPAAVFADGETPAEGLYYRSVRWRDGKVEADPDAPLQEGYISGSPGYSEARQFVYVDEGGTEHILADEDLTFIGDFFEHGNGNPDFMHEGEVLVDIIFTGVGDDGVVKYVTGEKEFAMKIISRLPEYGIYSTPEAREDSVLFSWDYNGKNDTIYFVSQTPGLLDRVYLPEEDAEWTGLSIGPVVDGTYAALTVTDIDSFQGSGFTLLYDYSLGEDEHYNGNEVWIFIFDERPLIWRWVNEENNRFWVDDNENRTMWTTPADNPRVQYSYIGEDGSETVLKLDDLHFVGCTADYVRDWDGNVVDESYIVLSFEDFGEARVSYVPEGEPAGTIEPIHVDLPEFGFYDIETPEAAEGTEEWNDELRAHYQTEWTLDGTDPVLYVRGAYNASLAYIVGVENHTDSDISWEIAGDERSVKITLLEPDPWYDWLDLEILCERRDDEGNVIYADERYGVNIRINDVRPRLGFCWVDSYWDDEKDREAFEIRDWEDLNTGLWPAKGEDVLVAFYSRDADGTERIEHKKGLVFVGEGELYEVEDLGDGVLRLQFNGWGEGSVSLSGSGYEDYLPVGISCDLPGFGLYSIEKPAVDDDHDPSWNQQLREAYVSEIVFDGTEQTYWIRGAYNESLAFITGIEQEGRHDIDWEIAEDEKSVRVTLKAVDPDDEWLHLVVYSEHRDGEDVYSNSSHLDIHIVNRAPALVFCWPDEEWTEEDGHVWLRSADDWYQQSLRVSKGRNNVLDFRFFDGEDLHELTFSDLAFSGNIAAEIADGQEDFVWITYTDWGEGAVSYTKDGKTYTLTVTICLPDVGFYSDLAVTEENHITRWVYTGENDTIYLMPNDGYVIGDVYSRDGAAIAWEKKDNYIEIRWDNAKDGSRLEFGFQFGDVYGPEGEINWYGGTHWEDIELVDARPGLVWRWADWWGWNNEENRPEGIEEREDERLDRSLTMSPGDEWWGQFFILDAEQNLTYAEELAFEESMFEAEKVELDGKVFWRIKCLDFGPSKLTSGGYAMKTDGVLPQVGFYKAPEATEENYMRGVWEYDGTEATATVYYIPYWGEEGDRWRLDDIRWEDGCGADVRMSDAANMAIITLTDVNQGYLDIEMIFSQYGQGDQAGEIVWTSDWRREGILVRDMRPRLIAGLWGWAGTEGDPVWECQEVWDSGDTGRWAGYTNYMNFWLPGQEGDPEDCIKSGIVSSDESVVQLTYDEKMACWQIDICGYGTAALTWTDPTNAKDYTFRIIAGEPDGFYDEPERYLDSFYGYGEIEEEPIDYTIGEGKTLYFSDLKYYDDGIDTITIVGENPMGVEVSEAEADTLWAIAVPASAEGDFEVTIRITLHLFEEDAAYINEHPEEYPDGYYEEFALSFHGVKQATRKLRSEDGYVEVVVNKDTGAFDVGGAAADAPVLVASYDENGRFLGLTIAAEGGIVNGKAEEGADEIQIFWVDETNAPKAEESGVPLN